MAEPALVLSPASAAAASRATPGARRAALPVRLRCRADGADQADAAPPTDGAAEDTTDYTGFSMVGVAG